VASGIFAYDAPQRRCRAALEVTICAKKSCAGGLQWLSVTLAAGIRGPQRPPTIGGAQAPERKVPLAASAASQRSVLGGVCRRDDACCSVTCVACCTHAHGTQTPIRLLSINVHHTTLPIFKQWGSVAQATNTITHDSHAIRTVTVTNWHAPVLAAAPACRLHSWHSSEMAAHDHKGGLALG
jgi:hypothetical protein